VDLIIQLLLMMVNLKIFKNFLNFLEHKLLLFGNGTLNINNYIEIQEKICMISTGSNQTIIISESLINFFLIF
jgi:hypothetical protein